MTERARRALRVLHDQLDARVSTIAEAVPSWPCRRGCDHCCRSLAEAPRLTAAEWELFCEGLGALDADVRAEVQARLEALVDRGPAAPPWRGTCPLLDQAQGACLVYAHRPIACRAYGFYATRDGGLWCEAIEARVEAGDADGVVLGNHDALDRALEAAAGPSRSLLEWLADPARSG